MGTLTYRIRLNRRLRELRQMQPQASRPERPSLVHWLTIVFGCMVAAFVLWGSVVILLALS